VIECPPSPKRKRRVVRRKVRTIPSLAMRIRMDHNYCKKTTVMRTDQLFFYFPGRFYSFF
jgi:hypothetical protein